MSGKGIPGATPIAVPSGALWCLTDGQLSFDPEVFFALPEADIAARLAAAGETSIRTEFNAFLHIGADGTTTSIDTGCGAEMGAVGGALPGLLSALGITPEAVDRLLFTHLHGDHCGGALDGDAAVFARAEVFLHHAEIAFAQAGERTGGRFVAAYAGRLHAVSEGQDISPDLRVWAPDGLGHIRGHTPGHIGVLVENAVVIAGDILHSEALQLPDPTICPIYDHDPALATQVRQAAMAAIADGQLIFTGGHILGPDKAARLQRDGAGFVKVPA